MKIQNYIICLLMLIGWLGACQSEEQMNEVGYLRLDIEANAFVRPQATRIAEGYDPKQLAVKIINAQDEVVESTTDWTSWQGKDISLPAGSYTIVASSNGFDGSESGFDIPYYVGSTQVNISNETRTTAEVECTLANVKVSVNFDPSFAAAFKSATASVASALPGVNSLDFVMGTTTKSGYFPVGNLTSTISVLNKDNETFSQSYEITNVQARDHYILNYKAADQGSMGGVDITVDESETIYTFNVVVSTKATTQLQTNPANAWSNFAYVSGAIVAFEGTPDPAKMYFEYKANSADTWTRVAAANSNDSYTATLQSLTPGTAYTCRMIYDNGTDTFTGNEETFTTETQNKIPNLSFDDWYLTSGNKATYYACKEADFAQKFWDSGNEGSNTLSSLNPTSKESTDIVKGNAARLSSIEVNAIIMKVFAAGNIYTGDFVEAKVSTSNPGAELDFGQPFTERPSKLTGYYKYNPGIVNKISDKVSQLGQGDRDQCSIYMMLCDWTTPFRVNTQTGTFVSLDNPGIIAYGELPIEKCSVESMAGYEKFSIDLKYRDLTRKPTYILLVCSASKYGDYFVGSTSSVLLIDEFDFEYGEPTIDSDYIK